MARAALFALVCLRAACLQRPSSLTAAPGPALAASAGASDDESLTLLYDSKCWACQWEVDHLTSNGADMDFVDIEADDYDGVESWNANGLLRPQAAHRMHAWATFDDFRTDYWFIQGVERQECFSREFRLKM